MRGRKPKPTAVRKLQGNPGKRPLNRHEARPDKARPRCPGWVHDEGKKLWRRIAGRLHDAGLLTYVDGSMFAILCDSYGRMIESQAKCAEFGSVIQTTNGNLIINPYQSVANRARGEFIKAAAEFGLSPSARSRIVVDTPKDTPSIADMLFAAIEE